MNIRLNCLMSRYYVAIVGVALHLKTVCFKIFLKWQYDKIFSLRFFFSNSSYSPNITYCASKNEFARRFLEETGPL